MDRTAILERAVKRAAEYLWGTPSFCPGRESEGWSLLWCGGRRANNCGACIAAWLKREEPAKAEPATSDVDKWLGVLRLQIEGAKKEVGGMNDGFGVFLGTSQEAPSSVAVLGRDVGGKRFLQLTDRNNNKVLLRAVETETLARLLQTVTTVVPYQSWA